MENTNSIRYFAVTCKHGHHGTGKFLPITFAIAAPTAPDACDMARQMPGVKHDAPVIACKSISREDYYMMRRISAYERSMLND